LRRGCCKDIVDSVSPTKTPQHGAGLVAVIRKGIPLHKAALMESTTSLTVSMESVLALMVWKRLFSVWLLGVKLANFMPKYLDGMSPSR
jgi:hypothetical protein